MDITMKLECFDTKSNATISHEMRLEHMTDYEQAVVKWVQLRNSALSRGKEFNLTVGYVKQLLKRKRCYYTGLPLTSNNISVERIDNSKGYIIGNVRLVDCRINQLRGNLDYKVLKRMVDKMGKHHSNK